MAAKTTAPAPQAAQDGRTDPPPPSDLGAAGKALWAAVVGAYALRDRELVVLAEACREADRACEADEVIASDGPYIADRYGSLKAHPAVAVARSSRLASSRLLRELHLYEFDLERDRPASPNQPGQHGRRRRLS
jgi:hypothetical protein